MDYEGLVNLDKSTTPISFNGKVYVGGNYLPASYSQDNKSNLEHKLALDAFIQNQERLRKEDEIKLTVELLNTPYNPIGWIPGLRSVVNAGADLNYFRTYNTAFTPYTTDAAFSTAGDAITLGFGLGPLKNYAGSYAGTVAGGLIGELFDNPLLGLIIGGITGGFSPLIYNTSKEFLSNKFGPYLVARTMNSSLKSALIPPELHPIRTNFNFGKGSGRVLRADKGDTIPLDKIFQRKMIFGDEAGNSIFINKLLDDKTRDILNKRLSNTPLYPMILDNGRYSHYDLDGNVAGYVNPLDARESMYIIGYKKGGKLNLKQ